MRRSAAFKRRAVQEARRLAAELKARLTADDVMCHARSEAAEPHPGASGPHDADSQLCTGVQARITVDNADCSGATGGARRQYSSSVSTPRSSCQTGGGFSGGSGGSRGSGFVYSRRLSGRSSSFASSAGGGSGTTGSRSSLSGGSLAGAGSSRRTSNSGRGCGKRCCSRSSRARTLSAVITLDPLMIDACIFASRPACLVGDSPPAGVACTTVVGSGSDSSDSRPIEPSASATATTAVAAAGAMAGPATATPANSMAFTVDRLSLQYPKAHAGLLDSPRTCKAVAGHAVPAAAVEAAAAQRPQPLGWQSAAGPKEHTLRWSDVSGVSSADAAADHKDQLLSSHATFPNERPASSRSGGGDSSSSGNSSATGSTATDEDGGSVSSVEARDDTGCPRRPTCGPNDRCDSAAARHPAAPAEVLGTAAAEGPLPGARSLPPGGTQLPSVAGLCASSPSLTARSRRSCGPAGPAHQRILQQLPRTCSLPATHDLQPAALRQPAQQQRAVQRSTSLPNRLRGCTTTAGSADSLPRRLQQQPSRKPAAVRRTTGARPVSPQRPVSLSLCGMRMGGGLAN